MSCLKPSRIRIKGGSLIISSRATWSGFSTHLAHSAWVPSGECQMCTVHPVLNGILTQQAPDDDGLVTLFCCLEATINGRPTTKLSDDPSDLLPLTLNHLLMLQPGPTLPPGAFVKQDLYQCRWRQVQYLTDIFWSRWLKEYLPALQQREKWVQPARNLQVGDLVLILYENTPCSWPLGLVIQAYPGADGLVRSVQVNTQSGHFNHPVSNACLLEANRKWCLNLWHFEPYFYN